MAIQESMVYSLKLCETLCCYLDWMLGKEMLLGLVSSHSLSSSTLRETSFGVRLFGSNAGHHALSL